MNRNEIMTNDVFSKLCNPKHTSFLESPTTSDQVSKADRAKEYVEQHVTFLSRHLQHPLLLPNRSSMLPPIMASHCLTLATFDQAEHWTEDEFTLWRDTCLTEIWDRVHLGLGFSLNEQMHPVVRFGLLRIIQSEILRLDIYRIGTLTDVHDTIRKMQAHDRAELQTRRSEAAAMERLRGSMQGMCEFDCEEVSTTCATREGTDTNQDPSRVQRPRSFIVRGARSWAAVRNISDQLTRERERLVEIRPLTTIWESADMTGFTPEQSSNRFALREKPVDDNDEQESDGRDHEAKFRPQRESNNTEVDESSTERHRPAQTCWEGRPTTSNPFWTLSRRHERQIASRNTTSTPCPPERILGAPKKDPRKWSRMMNRPHTDGLDLDWSRS